MRDSSYIDTGIHQDIIGFIMAIDLRYDPKIVMCGVSSVRNGLYSQAHSRGFIIVYRA